MVIILNYRHRNERLEDAFHDLGHSVRYNLWDIEDIISIKADAVIFEFKQILKEELRFINLSFKLKKNNIPRITWCLDIPNIGARRWKLSAILGLRLVDIFATHSLQGLPKSAAKILYLPNAAWINRYNMQGLTLDYFKNPDIFDTDVSFIGNINAIKCPEHKNRVDFLRKLGKLLEENNISYYFVDSKGLSFNAQIRLIQKSKINLNYGCGADRYKIKSWGLPERCYGIPACGGFLLSDERVHARNDFIEGEEIVMFKDLQDCFDKIRYYINSHNERRKIAENAHKRVLCDHTYEHRVTKLIDVIWKIKK
jgi:spore maturation protein CgeB